MSTSMVKTVAAIGSLVIWFGLFLAAPAQAAAPMATKLAPGFFRLSLGNFEITALSDGYSDMDVGKLLQNTSEMLTKRLLERAGQSFPIVRTSVNAFLVNTGEKLILIDTGTGNIFGPTLGKLPENLKASGYSPDQIDMVLLTHMHGDHIGGLLTPDGRRAFPNAVIMSSKAETEFWLSKENASQAPEQSKKGFVKASEVFSAYEAGGSWRTFEYGQDLLPGIRPEAAAGHTPGHTAFLISSQGKIMSVIGDCVHNAATQFPIPSITIQFDKDAQQATTSRMEFFTRAAREALLVAGMHLPFPGIGHIRVEGKGFAWLPIGAHPALEKKIEGKRYN